MVFGFYRFLHQVCFICQNGNWRTNNSNTRKTCVNIWISLNSLVQKQFFTFEWWVKNNKLFETIERFKFRTSKSIEIFLKSRSLNNIEIVLNGIVKMTGFSRFSKNFSLTILSLDSFVYTLDIFGFLYASAKTLPVFAMLITVTSLMWTMRMNLNPLTKWFVKFFILR